jgi:RNA polymerase primary sigma factor
MSTKKTAAETAKSEQTASESTKSVRKTPAKEPKNTSKVEKLPKEEVVETFSEEEDFEPGGDELEDASKMEVELDREIEEDLLAHRADLDNSAPHADPVRDYLREIGQIALLSHEQEVDLAKRIEIGLYGQKVLDDYAQSNKKVPPKRLSELEWVIEDGKKAKDYLVEANLRLVVSLAKRFSNKRMRFQDLIQEGNTGLLRAVEKYDFNTKFRFSTYATWWIRQAISRAIADRGRVIRIPVHMVEIINRLERTRAKMSNELGRSPSNDELAKEMNTTLDKIEEYVRYEREPDSIYTKLGDDGDTEVGDLIEDTTAPEHIETVMQNFKREQIIKVLDTLLENERKVIAMRYGLSGEQDRTLEIIGEELSVTRERVRQIEQKAMAKLRHPSRAWLLKDFVKK